MDYRDYRFVDGPMFEAFVASGANTLCRNIQKINDLNVFPIPDGDTGDNMYRTISGGVAEMARADGDTLGEKARALADGMLLAARGNSGVILSQLFAGLGSGLADKQSATISELGSAFLQGVSRAYETVVDPVEGTILTVARESVQDTVPTVDAQTTLGEFSDRFLLRMKSSLANTPELLDVLKEAGVIDSGGAGLYLIAEGAADAIRGAAVQTAPAATAQSGAAGPDLSLFTRDSVLEFGYCTEFLLRLMSAKVDVDSFDAQRIVAYLQTIGDSIVAVKTDSIVKVHVHTMTPSKALEFCQQFGEFLTVKIENMMLQHNEHVQRQPQLLLFVGNAGH